MNLTADELERATTSAVAPLPDRAQSSKRCRAACPRAGQGGQRWRSTGPGGRPHSSCMLTAHTLESQITARWSLSLHAPSTALVVCARDSVVVTCRVAAGANSWVQSMVQEPGGTGALQVQVNTLTEEAAAMQRKLAHSALALHTAKREQCCSAEEAACLRQQVRTPARWDT